MDRSTAVLLGALMGLALGCGDDGAGDAAPDARGDGEVPGCTPCTEFMDRTVPGMIDDADLSEISGVAASRAHAGVLWVHNDDNPAGARFYAVSLSGRTLARFTLRDATFEDAEDIAIGPGPGGVDWVYVGDIGDNAARTMMGTPRSSIAVYRTAEPSVDRDQSEVHDTLDAFDALPLRYPDGPHDAETLLVEPDSGDLYIITKEDDGHSTLFRAAAPLTPGVQVTLEAAGAIDFGTSAVPGSPDATGGDISACGTSILVRTYSTVLLWTRTPGQALGEALGRAAQVVPTPDEPQGEGVAFAPDGLGYYTISEAGPMAGAPLPPIYFFPAAASCR